METIGQVKNIKMVHEWKILYFSSLSEENSTGYYSPEFSFCNESWCVAMYPNGIDKYSTGYISLFLTKMSSGSPIKMKYSLGLKTLSEQKVYSTKVFEYTFEEAEDGFGHHKFILRSELFEKKADLLPSDVMTVFCTLQLPTSLETPVLTVENVSTVICSLCEKTVDADILSVHQKKDKDIKCAECSAILLLQNWCEHECQAEETDCQPTTALIENVSTVICSLCEKTVDADILSVHQKKDKDIKCAECSAILLLQNWCEHECQAEETDCQPTTALTYDKLSSDFKAILLSGDHSDTVVKVKTEEFQVHRSILAARNSYFDAMFKSDMKEKSTGIITIQDCEPNVFRSFMHFVYSGKVDKISPENVCELYKAADKYQEDQLKKICLEYMLNTMSVDNFCDCFILAFTYDEKKLLQKCIEFLSTNRKEIVRSVKWQKVLKEYPTQANELLIKLFDYTST